MEKERETIRKSQKIKQTVGSIGSMGSWSERKERERARRTQKGSGCNGPLFVLDINVPRGRSIIYIGRNRTVCILYL